jgi:hypothetical protein
LAGELSPECGEKKCEGKCESQKVGKRSPMYHRQYDEVGEQDIKRQRRDVEVVKALIDASISLNPRANPIHR